MASNVQPDCQHSFLQSLDNITKVRNEQSKPVTSGTSVLEEASNRQKKQVYIRTSGKQGTI